jgi:hypothetical protein
MSAGSQELTLDEAIGNLVSKGYHIVSQSPNSAQLTKPKRFPLAWFLPGVGVLLFLAFLAGIFALAVLVLYALVFVGGYALRRGKTVELRVNGGVLEGRTHSR